jgi:hypothetical protein
MSVKFFSQPEERSVAFENRVLRKVFESDWEEVT